MKISDFYRKKRVEKIVLKVTLAIILMLIAHSLLLALSAKTIKGFNLEQYQISMIESTMVALFIVGGIWYLRRRFNHESENFMGLSKLSNAIAGFFFGLGILLVPLILSLIVTDLANWAEIKINWQSARSDLILLGMLSVFITDAFPEEFVFRGYIYGQLHTKYSKFKSAFITTLLFVLFPLILFPVKAIFGSDLTTGLVNKISLGYIGYLLLFGSFAMYLRIFTNSIWSGIGFHLMLVYMNRLMGIDNSNLIQFSSFTNETNIQITLSSFLIITFILLFAYPKIKKKSFRKSSTTRD